MLRWLKRGIALTAALTLLCCTSVTSFAQDPLTLYTTQARFEDGNLSVLCRSNLADPTPEAFTGMLGTIDLQPEEVRPYQESGLGTTCLFLADVSGSISEQDITTIREIALQINSGLSAEDNGAVMTVGNEAYGNPITDDPAQREQQIAAISGVGEDTNLYASMIEALDLLTTSQDANFQKCLVVLSDGEDDYTTGVTREEVEKKIDETGIPVYTVAIVRDSYDTQKVEAAKVLGSFARLSPGGLDITFGLDGTTPQEAGQQIAQAMQGSFFVDFSVPASPVLDQMAQLKVTVEDADQKAEASFRFDTTQVRQWQQQQEESQESAVSQDPASSEDAVSSEPASVGAVEEANDAPGWLLYVWIGAGAVVVVAAVVIILLIRKKNKTPPVLPVEEESVPEMPVPPTDWQADAPQTTIPEAAPPVVVPEPLEAVVHISLTRVGVPEREVYELDMPDSLIIGRSPEQAALAFAQDMRLSSRHCKFTYENGGLYVEDLGSTNGTYINGIPVTGKRGLNKGDIILIGSMELRVDWQAL